jgi:hypothetical protein
MTQALMSAMNNIFFSFAAKSRESLIKELRWTRTNDIMSYVVEMNYSIFRRVSAPLTYHGGSPYCGKRREKRKEGCF